MSRHDVDRCLPPTIARAIERVRTDRAHGASWLARQAAHALASAAALAEHDDAGKQLEMLHATARAFCAVRPSMAALANTAARVWYAGWRSQPRDAPGRLRESRVEAERLASAWEQAAPAILTHARPLLGDVVLTHSRSGAVEAVLLALVRAGQIRRVLITQSHPGDEGEALARV
ncbi:MAG: hypothetical protein IVW57_12725, partial [Ktedonobacterales bacterium]|nr:hypothetical protein [Ktedonobacterales bacterium]